MGRSEPELIGLAEAAQKLGMPYQDAHRLLLTGSIRGEKRGNRWLVRLADVLNVRRQREGQHAGGPGAA